MFQRLHVRAPPEVGVGKGGREIGRHRIAFLLRLRDCLPRLQPREYFEPSGTALLGDGKFRERQPEILVFGKLETRRHDTDNGVDPRVHLNAPADDRRIAVVAPVPEIVGQQNHRFRTGSVIVGGEPATQLRRHAQ